MGKFRENILNPLFMEVFGTSVAIILTLGTDQIVKTRIQKEERKTMQMMVLANIEQFIRKLEMSAEELRKRDTAATWLLSLPMDQLDKVPYEVMKHPLNKATVLFTIHHDHTAESIFGADMGTWTSLENFIFVDNIGYCFEKMNDFQNRWNTFNMSFKEIISDIKMHQDDHPGELLTTKILLCPEVRGMMREIGVRIGTLEYQAAYLRTVNAENMKLVGVTQEELDDFIQEMQIESPVPYPNRDDYRRVILNLDSLHTIQPFIDEVGKYIN